MSLRAAEKAHLKVGTKAMRENTQPHSRAQSRFDRESLKMYMLLLVAMI